MQTNGTEYVTVSAAWLTADAISPSRTSIGPGFPAGKEMDYDP